MVIEYSKQVFTGQISTQYGQWNIARFWKLNIQKIDASTDGAVLYDEFNFMNTQYINGYTLESLIDSLLLRDPLFH